uniref:putative F-box/LRR-repeat protein At3g18150 n=1 Tax=Fragaria vesca subsp. vesca TaxID=101020 RepID=UPI0005CAF000|nr:PREDICTED: putative F-box/LRR-repeat protein At3g18150 [Fragaria vesca subsp. vesca]
MSSDISEGETCRKRLKTSKQDKKKAVMIRSSMPDLVIDRILALLPTKAAVHKSFISKQWEGSWSLSPVLDFDECAKIDEDDIVIDKLVEHRNFINILQRYLKFREKDKTIQVLDRFRLHMTRYLVKDSSIVDKWLSFTHEKSVKEVDLSLELGWHKFPDHEIGWYERVEKLYCISPVSLFHAKSITTLNLEFVRIQDTYTAKLRHARVLPSLKNMSLKSVCLDWQALGGLILECPSIESLSLDSCCFEAGEIRFSSSSLKSLKVTHCDARRIEVKEVVNLEYFTFFSELRLSSVTLGKCSNLKYISIHAQCLKSLVLHGCHDSLEATIHAPGLVDCRFTGFLNSRLYLKDPNLRTCIICLQDHYNRKSHNFQALRNFLEAFDGPDNLNLYISDFKVITFPQKFRETYLSPLPRLKQLMVYMSNIPTNEKDYSDLNDSLTWMMSSKKFHWTNAYYVTPLY